MFGFVSRKEFDALKNKFNDVLNAGDKTVDNFQTRITKLEAANNCRDGKHEWEKLPLIHKIPQTKRDVELGIEASVSWGETHEACKHCDIKNDEVEKPKLKDLPSANSKPLNPKDLSSLINNITKSQPKRKKGRK